MSIEKDLTLPTLYFLEIIAPYTHLRQVKGKQFREKIVLAFNYWLEVPEEQAQRAVETMTILHNASLMIDDIQDDTVVRRGMPAAHCVYGLPLTINASYQMAMVALQKALQLMPNGLGGYIYTEQIMEVVTGQGVDIYYRVNSVQLRQNIKNSLNKKLLGIMLLLGIRMLQLSSKNKKNYEEYAKLLGFYYQLRDDFGNLKQQEEVLAPYTHLLQVKGNHFHNRIVMAFNHWFKVPEEKLQSVLEVATMVQDATLLMDDIQDGSVVRRGMPAAHCIYGLPLTINAFVQVLTIALQKALELVPNGLGANVYAELFLDAVYGQGVDIYWRENFVFPTETEHRKMVQQKTGRIIMIGVKLLQYFSQNKTNYEDFVLLLGMYFQLRDDYCNLKHQEALEEWPEAVDANKNNNFCEDITEGKFSLTIIHAMNTPEGPQILSILRQRTRDVELKKYCVSLLEKSGSLQYTRDVLEDCDCKARAELARLGGNPLMEAVLDDLLSWKHGK